MECPKEYNREKFLFGTVNRHTVLESDSPSRISAARKAGLDSINAEVMQGTRRDAQWHSFGANKTHGLRRAKGDAKRSIEKILSDPEWSKVPQTKIAEHVGVSQQYVSKLYTDLHHTTGSKIPTRGPVEVTRNGTTYTTKHGTTATMRTENIGKRPDITATTNQTKDPEEPEIDTDREHRQAQQTTICSIPPVA